MNDNFLDLVEKNNEPRVRDTDLAVRLGMSRPANIRGVIEGNRPELLTYGSIHAEREMIPTAKGARRVVTVYYLNEPQAVLICTMSKARRAPEVRHAVISTYVAWRHGRLAAASTRTEIEAAVREVAMQLADEELRHAVVATIHSVLYSKKAGLPPPPGFTRLAQYLEGKGMPSLGGAAKASLSRHARKFSARNGYKVTVWFGVNHRRGIVFPIDALDQWWDESGRALAQRKSHEAALRDLPLFNAA